MFLFKLMSLMLIFLFLSACSSNASKEAASQSVKTSKVSTAMGHISRVETGRIVQLKKIIKTNDASLANAGSIGVSVGSGGHAGIYGSINAGNLIRAFRKPPKQLEIVIKKSSGGYVSVTQGLGGNFKVGEKVKIILRNGRAIVER